MACIEAALLAPVCDIASKLVAVEGAFTGDLYWLLRTVLLKLRSGFCLTMAAASCEDALPLLDLPSD